MEWFQIVFEAGFHLTYGRRLLAGGCARGKATAALLLRNAIGRSLQDGGIVVAAVVIICFRCMPSLTATYQLSSIALNTIAFIDPHMLARAAQVSTSPPVDEGTTVA